MNILKSRPNNPTSKFLSALIILSFICFLFFGFSINNTEAALPPPNTVGPQQTFTQTGAIPQNTPSPMMTNSQALSNWQQETGMTQTSAGVAKTPVITPSPVVQQSGPTSSADCGISVSGDKWNYCMLAPVNGLIAGKLTGVNEIVDLSGKGGVEPLPDFFSRIYKIGITIAVMLSIIVISIGGIRLATTDSISGTDEGRKMVNAALAGLFLALFSYVLLYTINPALLTNGAGTLFPAPTDTQPKPDVVAPKVLPPIDFSRPLEL